MVQDAGSQEKRRVSVENVHQYIFHFAISAIEEAYRDFPKDHSVGTYPPRFLSVHHCEHLEDHERGSFFAAFGETINRWICKRSKCIPQSREELGQFYETLPPNPNTSVQYHQVGSIWFSYDLEKGELRWLFSAGPTFARQFLLHISKDENEKLRVDKRKLELLA